MDWEIQKLKLSLDINSLQSYYQELLTSYPHLKWVAKDNLSAVEAGVGGHKIGDMFGYGIESNLDDLTLPAPPYNISKNKGAYRETVLVFGIIKQLKEMFPYSHQYSIAVHPTSTFVNQHIDSDCFLKIHIPIHTNPLAYFCFGNKKYHMPADGSMYLVNTKKMHGTINEGKVNRVHLFFKVPEEKQDDLLVGSETLLEYNT